MTCSNYQLKLMFCYESLFPMQSYYCKVPAVTVIAT